jgi:hypothetical protein
VFLFDSFLTVANADKEEAASKSFDANSILTHLISVSLSQKKKEEFTAYSRRESF